MARLPDTGHLVRQTPTPQRGVVSYDGTAVARAVEGFGESVGRVGEEYAKEQDAQAVMAARRALDDWERAAIFDPEKGAASRQGRDAFDLPKVLPASFDEAAGKAGAGLTSKRQRAAFQQIIESRRAQVADWANRHALKERNSYDEGQYQADLKAHADRAALFPDKAATENEMMRQRTIGYLRSKGRSEEEIQGALREQSSVIHARVIGAMVNGGNAVEAKAYLDANRNSMSGDAVLRAEAGLKEVVARGKAQAFGDEVMGKGLTLQAALAEARQRFQGPDEDAAVQEIKTRFSETEIVKAREQKESSSEAWRILSNGGSRKSIPPDLWNRLPGEEQRQINDWIDAKYRRAQADAEGKKTEDWGTYMGLRDMARDNPVAFADVNLMAYAPKLSKQQLESLVDLKGGISKDTAKAMAMDKALKQTESLVSANLKSAGIDTTPKEGSKQAEQLAAFRGALYLTVDAAMKEKGRPLTVGEQREIGLSLLREGVEQGSGFLGIGQSRKRGFEIVGEADPTKTYIVKPYGEIPIDTRRALEAEIYPNGVPRQGVPSEVRARIERAYTRGVELGRFR